MCTNEFVKVCAFLIVKFVPKMELRFMSNNKKNCVNEIYEVGQQVDNLQDSYESKKDISPEILQIIQCLDSYFDKPLPYNDYNYMTVYFYTKANYLTVKLRIANRHYEELHKIVDSYKKYDSLKEMYFELMLERMTFMRSSIAAYASSDFSISKLWMAQVHTNLANLYLETGRILESLEELESVKFDIGMAMGNYGGKLYELAKYSLDESEQKEALLNALSHFQLVVNHGKDDSYIRPEEYHLFCESEVFIKELLNNKYSEIPVYSDFPDNSLKDLGIEDNQYRKWCRDNRLAISFRNIVDKYSSTDDMHLPNLGIAYFSKDDTLSYYSWFNTIKQEYNMARYSIFQIENIECNIDDTHLSQQDILLINTLDYPAIGYRTEMLKLSSKTAYGVLDKIGGVDKQRPL